LTTFLLNDPDVSKHEEIPVVRLDPPQGNHRIVIWADPQGKRSLFAEDGKPRPSVQKLLDAGYTVLAADLFDQGEFTSDGKPIAKAPLVDGHIEFTFGYNPPIFAQRVRDLLKLVAFAHSDKLAAEQVNMVGLNGTGHWVAAARAIAGDKIDRAAIDTGGFRFATITTFDNPDFLPGGVKYNDLPGMIALSAPNAIWLAGEGKDLPPIIAAAYNVSGQPDKATVFPGEPADRENAAIEWLLK
jgi:hypothetical protein